MKLHAILCVALIFVARCYASGGDPYYNYTNLKMIWNPRFVNPYNDPDFNDFDKSGWNPVYGGSGEFIHHQMAGLVIDETTGEIVDFNGQVHVSGRSAYFYELNNETLDYQYPGHMCVKNLISLIGVNIVDPYMPDVSNCMGSCWHYRTPFTYVQHGHVFEKGVYFTQPFDPTDNMTDRIIRMTARGFEDWYTLNNLWVQTPYLKSLNESFRPYAIELAEALPVSVVANTPFTVKLKMVNKFGETITSSFNSGLEIMAQVAYTHKWFDRRGGLWLTHTDAVLAGPEVQTSVINDQVIFARFNKGVADISMQIEDVYENLELNFTSKWPLRNYRRYPSQEFHPTENKVLDYSSFQTTGQLLTHPDSNSTHIKYQHCQNDPNYFRGVKIARINVTAQTAVKLRIISPNGWKQYQYVNRELKGPVQVEAIDSNNRRVTSGPDSKLEVTVAADVQAVRLSGSTIRLNRGIGTMKGSIISNYGSAIHLTFSATTSGGNNIQSETSPSITMQAYFFAFTNVVNPSEMNSFTASEYIYTMQQNAVLSSKSRPMYYLTSDSVNEMFSHLEHEEEQTKAKWQERPDFAIVLGPSNPDLLDGFVSVQQGRNLPMINYQSEDSKYSDKKRYPNFLRMRYSNEYQYAMICNFLKSRKWDNLVVIAPMEKPISNDFISCTTTFDIKYNPVSFPAVTDDNFTLSNDQLDTFFGQLTDANIKTIVSLLTGPALRYMVAEATKRGFSRANGYQWIGAEGMKDDFPYENDGRCADIQGTTCVDTFKGTIMFSPNYATYGFNNGNWGAFRATFATALDYSVRDIPGFVPHPLTTDEEELLQCGLMYDAANMMSTAMLNIIDDAMTFNTEDFLERFSKVELPLPLSGDSIVFDDNYDRTNYSAVLYQIDGTSGSSGKANVFKAKRYLYLGDNVAPYNITVDNKIKEIPVAGQNIIYIETAPSSEKIAIEVHKTSATMNLQHQTSGPLVVQDVTETIPPAYYCTGGCGGQQLSSENRLLWQNGECVSHETCACKLDSITGNPQYSGKRCEAPVCTGCIYGNCDSPGNCTCLPGYIDSNVTFCSIPTCTKYGCTFGSCTAGDFCKCTSGYYGKDCSKKCDCENGKCSDGNSGTGKCSCDSGYTGSTCSVSKAVLGTGIAIGLACLFGVLFFIGRYFFKKIELNAQLMSTEWVVEWDSIRMRQKKNKSSMKSLMSMISMMSTKSGKDDREEKVVCQNQGNWNGKDIVVKLLRKENVELTHELRWEVKEMRDIKHPNLCLFIGACIDTDHVAILNEVCGKGSLEDILSNDDIDLGWDFRYSMMKDVVRGMIYLQNTDIGSHGRLKSSNCLVDNRWTVKLSDYGMKSFKMNQEGVRVFSPENGIGVELPSLGEMDGTDYYNLLWTAPEIVATGVSHLDHVGYGTIVGDIYSFSIILCEMCTRHHPFHEIDHLGPDEIVQIIGRLRDPEKNLALVECKDHEKIPVKCLRPQVNPDELPEDENQSRLLMELIKLCWNQDPLCRPTFKECMSKLGRISPHRGELMDNLIELMEQYTTSLESIVAERTADVVAEKEKGDLLLSKMLPPLIAEELKLGKNPQPEYFNSVTIYFSDCVGFGQICANASPYQVVELLNDLYSVMDDIIESFDCYKVETIGDCYVVASGLPTRNGDNHAGEVASMALALMTAISGVSYKNMPGTQVQLRMGLNTGPIVAGVVGSKMPRYCLFGDTMNTASRMESGGFALKIHMSESTFKVLETLGGYQSICRGEREVKGKGKMTTYWLTGKDGSEYKLPPEELALSVSQHNFK